MDQFPTCEHTRPMGQPCPICHPKEALIGAPAPSPQRVSWDRYFMRIAHEASTRATCDRKHVGAVLVYDKRIIATGYNGSVPGADHCDDAGHDMLNGHCVRTVHAEVNAIAQAARSGARTLGSAMYVNTFPCWPCMKVMLSAGVASVLYDAEYRNDERVMQAAMKAGVEVRRIG